MSKEKALNIIIILLLIVLCLVTVLAVKYPLRSNAPDTELSPGPTSAPVPSALPEETPAPTSEPDKPRFNSGEISSAFSEILPDGSGDWDIYLEELSSGEIFTYGEPKEGGEVSASLIKLFIMGAVYEKISLGELEHDSVYPLLYSMITISSNESANSLTLMLGNGDPNAGMAAVNAYAESIGCTHTRMNRLMLVNNGLQNYTSAADCARFLRLVYFGICVSPEYSEEILQILCAQRVNDRIPMALPAGTVIAHKTGDLLNVVFGDVAIVYSDKGTYLLCIICENPPDYEPTLNRFVRISEYVYNSIF